MVHQQPDSISPTRTPPREPMRLVMYAVVPSYAVTLPFSRPHPICQYPPPSLAWPKRGVPANYPVQSEGHLMKSRSRGADLRASSISRGQATLSIEAARDGPTDCRGCGPSQRTRLLGFGSCIPIGRPRGCNDFLQIQRFPTNSRTTDSLVQLLPVPISRRIAATAADSTR